MTSENSTASDSHAPELRDLHKALLDLGNALRAIGGSSLAEAGEKASEEARGVAEEVRRLLGDLEQRAGPMQKTVENSLREHPAAWASGLLGAVAVGIVLGQILRGQEQ